jgi:GNAT superfamily N-acetyltransferase
VSGDPAFTLLGWPESEPTLRLDHRAFAYAGKFVVSRTGKAVLHASDDDPLWGRDAGEFARGVLAAVAFDADRTDPDRLVLRYVTVRADRQGEGLGPLLVDRLLARAATERRYGRARIAVNNPFAYEALYRAGFAYTGETTGIAELVLERPVDRPATADADRYRAGLERFRRRDLSDAERAFVGCKRAGRPPSPTGDERA